jgi:hypothetical protein
MRVFDSVMILNSFAMVKFRVNDLSSTSTDATSFFTADYKENGRVVMKCSSARSFGWLPVVTHVTRGLFLPQCMNIAPLALTAVQHIL